ncbi:hypothetical protein IAT38_003322 [Cryptococcus sp. DSM 104549]
MTSVPRTDLTASSNSSVPYPHILHEFILRPSSGPGASIPLNPSPSQSRPTIDGATASSLLNQVLSSNALPDSRRMTLTLRRPVPPPANPDLESKLAELAALPTSACAVQSQDASHFKYDAPGSGLRVIQFDLPTDLSPDTQITVDATCFYPHPSVPIYTPETNRTGPLDSGPGVYYMGSCVATRERLEIESGLMGAKAWADWEQRARAGAAEPEPPRPAVHESSEDENDWEEDSEDGTDAVSRMKGQYNKFGTKVSAFTDRVTVRRVGEQEVQAPSNSATYRPWIQPVGGHGAESEAGEDGGLQYVRRVQDGRGRMLGAYVSVADGEDIRDRWGLPPA